MTRLRKAIRRIFGHRTHLTFHRAETGQVDPFLRELEESMKPRRK